MQVVELTWSRVFKIWWAALWRSVIYANLFGGAFMGTVGICMVVLGHREWGSSRWFISLVTVVWLPAFLMGMRMALCARYRDFQVVLVGQDFKTESSLPVGS